MTTPLRAACALAACALAGCAPTLQLTRPALPEASLVPLRALSVDVTTKMGKAVETSVLTGLVLGEIPVPVPMHAALRTALVETLEGLGFQVCPAAPCGEGALTAVLTESAVSTQFTRSGPEAHARITARIQARHQDGRKLYDFTFWARRSGSPQEAGALVKGCADGIAARMRATLLPRTETVSLPLEDGGPLGPGVELLLAHDLNGALAFFGDLTRRQPDLAGAWYDLGVAWEAAGDWAQALAAYEQAVARQRKSAYVDALEALRLRLPPPPPPQAAPPAPPPPP